MRGGEQEHGGILGVWGEVRGFLWEWQDEDYSLRAKLLLLSSKNFIHFSASD